jgi:hypothetical protein
MRRYVQIPEIAYNPLKAIILSISEPVVLEKRICRTADSGIVSSIFCHLRDSLFVCYAGELNKKAPGDLLKKEVNAK